MQVNSALFTSTVLCSITLLAQTAEASSSLQAELLTTGNGTAAPSAELLLGISEQLPMQPVLAKKSLYIQAIPDPVAGISALSAWRYPLSQAAASTTLAVTAPLAPRFSGKPPAVESLENNPFLDSDLLQPLSSSISNPPERAPTLNELLPSIEQIVANTELPNADEPSAQEDLLDNDSLAAFGDMPCHSNCLGTELGAGLATGLDVGSELELLDTENVIARSLPSLEEVQQIQQDLRNLNTPEPIRNRRSVYPGITISNPSGYGADRGRVFAGIGYQSRTRFTGGRNPGTIFGGGRRDGIAGIGFGLGDARESVGLQLSYTAASFGGSRDPLSGGLNAKLHKQFGNGLAAAIGGEGIINFGRLREGVNGEVEFNDFEGTYYGVTTYTIPLRENYTDAFSRLTLNAGVGTGRFRSSEQIINGDSTVGVFGTAALQVLPSTNLITEWTGQDLAVGISVAPFPNFPVVFTPAIRDIAGEGDGDPRFVMGVGVSLTDLFSNLGF